MATKDKTEQQIYIAKSIMARGKILHEISLLEMALNLYLAIHFCGRENVEKMTDIQLLIFGDDRM
jgi:hypothetical protein